jgi:hypothetical protein
MRGDTESRSASRTGRDVVIGVAAGLVAWVGMAGWVVLAGFGAQASAAGYFVLRGRDA